MFVQIKIVLFQVIENLPITVIDERIYNEPPTLLIGTIDKFASVTWLPKQYQCSIMKNLQNLI